MTRRKNSDDFDRHCGTLSPSFFSLMYTKLNTALPTDLNAISAVYFIETFVGKAFDMLARKSKITKSKCKISF